MQTLSKLLHVLTLLGINLSAVARPSPEPRSLRKRFGSLCDLSNDDISTVIPANINDGQSRPLLAPIADHPSYVVLGVGYANYTCLPNSTWLAIGGLLELFDLSCTSIDQRESYTTSVQQQWLAAPADYTALDLIEDSETEYKPYSVGQHYWVPDPLDPSDGTFNPKWDFGSRVWNDALENATDPETAYLYGYRTGIVPAPVDPAVNIEWVTLAPLTQNGQPLGLFADQVFRIFTNGGSTSSDTCDPNGPMALVKTTLNFWYYGGYWADHTS